MKRNHLANTINCDITGPVIGRVRVRLDRRQVIFLRFLIEGYEGLATATTVDPWASIVDLHVPVERLAELTDLLSVERDSLGITKVEQGVP
jgi:hypothetical protein